MVLTAADLGATLQISPRTLKAAHFAGRWTITGLTYRSLEKETLEHWLDFLQHGTQDYSPQPYQQFVAVARAHGDERLTRNILITQRDDQRIRGQLNHWQKAGLHVLQATVGYGYQSWKALVWLGGLLIMAGIMIHGLGTEEINGLHRPANPQVGVSEGLCTGIDLLTLTIQILPLLPLPPAATNACVPDTTPGGYAYLLLSTLMKIGAWALVTLFATGYTNIVRRPHT
ncbi:hypothetical protein [Kocuria arenosa]|uniref:hypothetical protein n=1 Tax=Kocuria arenosa TaxID=3071446 RepID=UPI0034D5FFA6